LPANEIKLPLVKQSTRYVFFILKCFGVYEEEDGPSVMSDESTGNTVNFETQITPLMNVLSEFRDKVK